MYGAPLIYSCDFHDGRLITTLLMFVLNLEFLNLTINMQPLTTVTSQVHSARHHQRGGTVLYRASSLLYVICMDVID